MPEAEIAAITRKLFEREAKTWRSWEKQGKWSAEQRSVLAEAGILSASKDGKAS